MKKKVFVFAVFWLLACFGYVNAVQLMLPFPGGETWRCSQGNYDDPSNTPTNQNPTHLKNSGMDYAWDFNWGSTDSADLGKPVIAPASGIIVYAEYASGWGNTVIIDYGDGTYGKLAHLESVIVNVGDSVGQGQQVGTCGGTGGNWPPHIHYQTQNNSSPNGQSIQSTFSDANVLLQDPDGVPKEGKSYISDNYYTPATYFTFKNGSEGWTPGFDAQNVEQTQADAETWMVATDDFDGVGGNNPGVVSPSFAKGVNAKGVKRISLGH